MSALVRRGLRIYGAKLLRTVLNTEHVRRFRDRAGRIGRKLMLAGYIYVATVVIRIVLDVAFGVRLWG